MESPMKPEEILLRAVEWWKREGYKPFAEPPEWVFAARQLLEPEAEDLEDNEAI